MNIFLCSRVDSVFIYDSYTYKQLGKLNITLLKSTEREPNQVLAMQKSQNEMQICVVTGKNLVASQQKVN